MRFLVFGAGAMGSLIGGLLAQKHDVTLVGRKAHVEAIRKHGLVIHGRTEARVGPRAVETAREAYRPDVVIVTVKSYDTEAAAEELRPFRESAVILSLQNGLGNVEQLAARSERVLGGVTYHGVTFVGPGEVSHAGTGDTVIGPIKGTTLEDAEWIRAAFDGCGLATTVAEDIQEVLWTKAVVNACFNPITGLLRVKSGVIGRSGQLMECCNSIVEEALGVARAEGIQLEREALMQRVRDVSSATAENRSSMLQDLERGRRTEIDAINGWIAHMGAEHGVACPVNRTLTLLVKAAERVEALQQRA
jgi:2-dehydropantoate 2-reductase